MLYTFAENQFSAAEALLLIDAVIIILNWIFAIHVDVVKFSRFGLWPKMRGKIKKVIIAVPYKKPITAIAGNVGA